MTRLDEVTKEYRESAALNSLIAIHAAIGEATFLTKGGQLLQVLRVEGIDHECLDHQQLDRVARRFEAAIRIFPATFHLYQLVFKQDRAELPHQEPAHPAVREAVRNRIDYLQAKADALYTFELYFVV